MALTRRPVVSFYFLALFLFISRRRAELTFDPRPTTGTFLLDQLKSYILTLALELPILAGILKIIERVGSEGVLQIVAWLMLFM